MVKPSPARELGVANALVVEACLACLGSTYGEHKAHHLAEVVAGYCRMARKCAAIPHEEEYPQLGDAKASLKNEIDRQYEILNEYLEELSK